jgi:ferrous iron transport protein A
LHLKLHRFVCDLDFGHPVAGKGSQQDRPVLSCCDRMKTVLNFYVAIWRAPSHAPLHPPCSCIDEHLRHRPLMSGEGSALPLCDAATGVVMTIVDVRDEGGGPEWPLRLRELGFIEGEEVCVLRRGQPGGEPLAVRVGGSTFALRRAEAGCVQVVPADGLLS